MEASSISAAHDKGNTHRSAAHDKGHARKCIPKKDGAGGRGAWGKAGEELDVPEVMPGDPMYDEGEDDRIEQLAKLELSKIEPLEHLGEGVVDVSKEEIDAALTPAILEYFENADATDVIESVQGMKLGIRRFHIVELIVELGLERHDDVRELCSKLISLLYGSKIVSYGDVMHGFDALLKRCEDLKLDTPDAPDVLGKFLARAVADDCLPPAYVDAHPAGLPECTDACAHATIKKAHTLLHMTHAISHLDQVWGVHGQRAPVKYVVKKIILIIKEFLSSSDLKEAEHCLHELGVPHFHHEVVYEAVMVIMEKDGDDHVREQVLQLVAHFYAANIITVDQMEAGLKRIQGNLHDITLDVPRAPAILQQIAQRGRALGFIAPQIADTLETAAAL